MFPGATWTADGRLCSGRGRGGGGLSLKYLKMFRVDRGRTQSETLWKHGRGAELTTTRLTVDLRWPSLYLGTDDLARSDPQSLRGKGLSAGGQVPRPQLDLPRVFGAKEGSTASDFWTRDISLGATVASEGTWPLLQGLLPL